MTLIFLRLCIEFCPLYYECNEATDDRKCQGIGQSKFLEQIRNLLVAQRKKLMDTLESQGDFPDPKLIEAFEAIKKRIMDLDSAWVSSKGVI